MFCCARSGCSHSTRSAGTCCGMFTRAALVLPMLPPDPVSRGKLPHADKVEGHPRARTLFAMRSQWRLY